MGVAVSPCRPFLVGVAMYWVEVRANKRRGGRPCFWPYDEVRDLRGFRSVYAYTDETRQDIEQRRSTAGLAGVSVYSDTIFVDFDGTDPEPLLHHLLDTDTAYDAYWSGGRSWHIHIPCNAVFGSDVPQRQKLWVAGHAPGADLTFYHPAGQFRLEGTRHEKTGQKKELRRCVPGMPLDLPELVARPITKAMSSPTKGNFIASCMRKKIEGGRRVYAWHLAMLALREGLDFTLALDWILWWNRRHCTPPLPDDILEDRVREVFRKGTESAVAVPSRRPT